MKIRAISGVNSEQSLTPAEKAQVARLAARDREVRAHEAQHLAAAGSLASGVEYTYQTGPDGKMYAIGGKVRIIADTGGSPEEALANARQIRAAANAPDDPSAQDMSVAAKAGTMEADALLKVAEQKSASNRSAPGSKPPGSARGFDGTA
jgi:hypothetical protein